MGRTAGYRKENYNYRSDSYIHGNTVSSPGPVRNPQRHYEEPLRPGVSRKTRRNREKALRFNFAYVAFLTAAAVISVFVCVNYLKLQAESTTRRNVTASLESQLNELRTENDAEYEKALSSVDLEYIKDVAINKLGMVFAGEGQIITYNSQEGDYVRQYEDVPMK